MELGKLVYHSIEMHHQQKEVYCYASSILAPVLILHHYIQRQHLVAFHIFNFLYYVHQRVCYFFLYLMLVPITLSL